MSTDTKQEIVTVERQVHTGKNGRVIIYWVSLRRPNGTVVRAFPTKTMTDADILRQTIESTVREWMAQP